MVTKLYFFDGYNILHASDHTKKILNGSLEEAREVLIDNVLNYLGVVGDAMGVVVFDSPDQPTYIPEYRTGLEIYYGHTADSVIERLSRVSDVSTHVVLVSSDNVLFNAIQKKNQIVTQLRSEYFWVGSRDIPGNYRSRTNPDNSIAGIVDRNTYDSLNKLRGVK